MVSFRMRHSFPEFEILLIVSPCAGNKLAWSMKPISREVRITVDIDKEENRTPRPGKENVHRVVVRQTNRVRMDMLIAYLEGKMQFDNSHLEVCRVTLL